MLTLALTGIVPLTGEPGAGDVMVTIRLPPGSGGSICAKAWVEIKASPEIANSAAALIRLPIFSMDRFVLALAIRPDYYRPTIKSP